MSESLKTYFEQVVQFIGPNPQLQALLVAILAIVAAKLAVTLLVVGIGYLARRSKTKFDDQFVHMLRKPVFMTVLLIGLSLAVARLELAERIEGIMVASLKSIGIMVWSIFILRAFRLLLAMLQSRRDKFSLVDDRMMPLMQNAAVMVIAAAALYALMNAWQVDVTALLASAGILGLALSFAAKDTLANVFAGVSILADAPYKVGDFVVLQTGERGIVTQIGIRSSRLLTRDDVEITIPNSVIGNAMIVNESGGPHEKFRIRVQVSVAYGSDLDQVCHELQEVAHGHPEICKIPNPRVRVRGFGSYGVDIELLAWVVRPVERGRMLHEMYIAVYKRFGELDIEIPYPKHEVFLRDRTERTLPTIHDHDA